MVVHLVWWHSWNSSNIFHPIHGVLIIRDRDIPASVWMEMVFYFEINIKCNVFCKCISVVLPLLFIDDWRYGCGTCTVLAVVRLFVRSSRCSTSFRGTHVSIWQQKKKQRYKKMRPANYSMNTNHITLYPYGALIQ